MKSITTFGEVMLRISPKNKGELLTQSNIFRIEPGGSEIYLSENDYLLYTQGSVDLIGLVGEALFSVEEN